MLTKEEIEKQPWFGGQREQVLELVQRVTESKQIIDACLQLARQFEQERNDRYGCDWRRDDFTAAGTAWVPEDETLRKMVDTLYSYGEKP